MPQVLKDEVQERIARAALEVFASEGFESATMAAIARRAGISTGNIYRYFGSKQALFEAVVTPDLVAAFLDGLRQRVGVLQGVRDLRELSPGAPYHTASEALLRFCLAHRLQVVTLLGHAEGTRYAGFREQLEETLRELAMAHFRELDPGLEVTPARAFGLAEIYRHFVDTMLRILTSFEGEAEVRAAVADYSRFHLTGLLAFFTE